MKDTMTDTIKKETVLIVRPEKVPRKKDMVLSYEEFGKVVQGNLQIIRCKELSVAFIFNKYRKELCLPLNRAILSSEHKFSHLLFGPFIVVGLDENLNYTGLTQEQLGYYKNRFYVPARMVMVDGKPRIEFDLLAR